MTIKDSKYFRIKLKFRKKKEKNIYLLVHSIFPLLIIFMSLNTSSNLHRNKIKY